MLALGEQCRVPGRPCEWYYQCIQSLVADYVLEDQSMVKARIEVTELLLMKERNIKARRSEKHNSLLTHGMRCGWTLGSAKSKQVVRSYARAALARPLRSGRRITKDCGLLSSLQ
ncbi:hypothetical protein NDU88_002720 [Pleurodeles waltl]|uniref:Uncharacterized protein n=1 Tax=Pleurodeles waltl TaxID=8319 RepID=A0AAV7UD68_PLEWA|nr:hypothetical protein NDU88_002720 [Pleurodeles waltl]